MVLLLAAVLANSAPDHPVAASAQATATIRIISAVQIKFGEAQSEGVPAARDAIIRSADGTIQAAKLVEFQ